MEPERNKRGTALSRLVLGLDTGELDRFWSCVDFDPDLPHNDAQAHWHYRTNYLTPKGEGYEDLLQYRGIGNWDYRINARRLAFLLINERDEALENACGIDCCINPAHQRIRIKNT